MRIRALAALLLIGAAPPSQDLPLSLNIGGRVVKDADGGLRFGWPGVYFEGRFEGDWVATTIQTDSDLFRLMVDGRERARLGPDKLRAMVGNLGPGVHTVRLEKLTGSQSGSSRFLGFTVPHDAKPLPAPVHPRRIEFIGDSHSVGYGDTSLTRTCTPQQVHDTTDTSQAFGPLVAEYENADYRVIAYSGYGIVRNYAGGVPGDSLPNRYTRAIPGEEALADDGGWQPDWVVVNLGTNDFSTPLHRGEAWKTPAALHAAFRTGYVAFLRTLMAKYPKARFMLMFAPEWEDDIVAIELQFARRRFVISIATPDLELTGCDWHPSFEDQSAIASKIIDSMYKIGPAGLKP